MLYLVICDISRLRAESAAGLSGVFGISSFLPEKKGEEKERSLGAYLTLAQAYEHITVGLGKREKMPPLYRDLLGKPHFKESGILKAFSISHAGELVTVALSDTEAAIGVDVEEERELKNPDKISSRLCINENSSLQNIEKEQVKYLFASMREDGGIDSFSPVPDIILDYMNDKKEKKKGEKEAKNESLFRLWTLTEAMLKADGGGFCSIRKLCEIASRARCLSVAFNLSGRRVFLSAAAL